MLMPEYPQDPQKSGWEVPRKGMRHATPHSALAAACASCVQQLCTAAPCLSATAVNKPCIMLDLTVVALPRAGTGGFGLKCCTAFMGASCLSNA